MFFSVFFVFFSFYFLFFILRGCIFRFRFEKMFKCNINVIFFFFFFFFYFLYFNLFFNIFIFIRLKKKKGKSLTNKAKLYRLVYVVVRFVFIDSTPISNMLLMSHVLPIILNENSQWIMIHGRLFVYLSNRKDILWVLTSR
jgi:hypothetical protein